MASTTIQQFFQQLKIIHLALIAGQVMFVVIVFFLLEDPLKNDEITGWETMAPYAIGLTAVVFYALSRFAVNAKLKRVKNRASISTKLAGYRESMILRWALLETPSFIAIIGAFMMNESIYLLFSALFIIIFVMEAPSVNRAIILLALEADERATLENPATAIETPR